MLRDSLVARLGSIARSGGLSWGLTTGSGWIESTQHAEAAASRLAAAGVGHVTASVDRSHMRHARPEYVEAFILALVNCDVRVTVSCTTNDPEERIELALPTTNLKVEYHYVSSVGYAGRRNPTVRLSLAQSRCPMRGEFTISVWPDGLVYPCCSVHAVNKKHLAIGSVFEDSVEQLLDRATRDPYLSAIQEIGFSGIIALVGDRVKVDWKNVFAVPLADACHLCSRIASHDAALTDLRSALKMSTQLAIDAV